MLVAQPAGSGRTLTWTLKFPAFWRGPIWIQFWAPQQLGVQAAIDGKVELIWGHWRRRQVVQTGKTLTTRKATLGSLPLTVTTSTGLRLAAGMGVLPGAHDVNHDWYPVSLRHAAQLVLEGWRTIHRNQ